MKEVHGFKIFNPNWSCFPWGNIKQYTCPGEFEEDVVPTICKSGMHFCKNAISLFNYYDFDPENKIAEVIAYGDIDKSNNGDKYCTNKLKIIREVSWNEILKIVNIGKDCTGLGNTGNKNSGNYNTGDFNLSNLNTGNKNLSGNRNSGNYNFGWKNTGSHNKGSENTGYYNFGDSNTGIYNNGYCNTGNANCGDNNTGNYNIGSYNCGDYNLGNYNWGDWNKCNYSLGCFNTINQKIYLFNKPSEWTYEDWMNSKARFILASLSKNCRPVKWVKYKEMTPEEKKYEENLGAKLLDGYLTDSYFDPEPNSDFANNRWRKLPKRDKEIIMNIPNFDKDIFKEITGIDIEED